MKILTDQKTKKKTVTIKCRDKLGQEKLTYGVGKSFESFKSLSINWCRILEKVNFFSAKIIMLRKLLKTEKVLSYYLPSNSLNDGKTISKKGENITFNLFLIYIS